MKKYKLIKIDKKFKIPCALKILIIEKHIKTIRNRLIRQCDIVIVN